MSFCKIKTQFTYFQPIMVQSKHFYLVHKKRSEPGKKTRPKQYKASQKKHEILQHHVQLMLALYGLKWAWEALPLQIHLPVVHVTFLLRHSHSTPAAFHGAHPV